MAEVQSYPRYTADGECLRLALLVCERFSSSLTMTLTGFRSTSTFVKGETPLRQKVFWPQSHRTVRPRAATCSLRIPSSRGGAGLHDRGEPGCREEDCTGLREGAGAPGGQRPGQKGNGGAQGREEGAPRPDCGLRGLSAQFLFLPDVLQWRAHTTPDHPLFLLLNAKVRLSPRPGAAPPPSLPPAVFPAPLFWR